MEMNFDNIFNLQKMMMLVNHACYQTVYIYIYKAVYCPVHISYTTKFQKLFFESFSFQIGHKPLRHHQAS
jgi:hypothetical protein